MQNKSRVNILLIASFVLSLVLLFGAGLKQRESQEAIDRILALSVTMGGFGLVAFQIARASNELRNDFIESTILMILSTVSGFFYFIYPNTSLLGFNFGELSIFIFFWALILFLGILIDKRFNFLK
jgi:cation transport ATPase